MLPLTDRSPCKVVLPPTPKVPEMLAVPLTSKVFPGLVEPMPTLPDWVITNRGRPAELAVKRSPIVLSTIKVAKLVAPEILAMGRIPELLRSNAPPLPDMVVAVVNAPPKVTVFTDLVKPLLKVKGTS